MVGLTASLRPYKVGLIASLEALVCLCAYFYQLHQIRVLQQNLTPWGSRQFRWTVTMLVMLMAEMAEI